MTATVIRFVPRRELSAAENITGFIGACQDGLKSFGEAICWSAPTWDITDSVERTSRKRRGRIAIVWSNHDTSKQRVGATMALPFLDFAKGYILYQHAMRPTDNLQQRVTALRALERALVESSIEATPRAELASGAIFNRAAELLQEKFSEDAAYKIGAQLQMIAEFLRDHLLLSIPFSWKNPIPRQKDKNRVGKKFNDERAKRLPTQTALNALASAFNQARQPKDVIITSIAALLACAPSRISEALSLPLECEHVTRHPDGKEAFGIRWWPAKGASPQIKWIVGTMVDVAKSAIQNIRHHTEEARRMAKCYTEHPEKLYLPDDLNYLRNKEYLLPQDIADIIGIGKSCHAGRWADENGCNKLSHPGNRRLVQYRFAEVEAAVLRLLPKGFPLMIAETDLHYRDALILVPKNLLHPKRATYRCMFDIVTEDDINCQLGGGTDHGKSSVFSRMGLTETDGSPVKINTHQLRHWLNTLANGGCLSQLDIALWSGRKDIRQNVVYDHVTADDLLTRLRDIRCDDLPGGGKEIALNAPMTREQYLFQKFPTAHATPFGFCVHDWTALPCQRHADCLNCREHICLKCDSGKAGRIRQALEDVEIQLVRAEEAVADEYYGADRWLAHHRKTAEVLRSLVSLLDDTSIPNSSIFQLSIQDEYSEIRAAVDDRRLGGNDDAIMLGAMPLLESATTYRNNVEIED